MFRVAFRYVNVARNTNEVGRPRSANTFLLSNLLGFQLLFLLVSVAKRPEVIVTFDIVYRIFLFIFGTSYSYNRVIGNS